MYFVAIQVKMLKIHKQAKVVRDHGKLIFTQVKLHKECHFHGKLGWQQLQLVVRQIQFSDLGFDCHLK